MEVDNNGKQDKECYRCSEKGHLLDCSSRIHQDKTVNKMENTSVDDDAPKKFVFTTDNIVEDVSLSSGGF